ncbi:MAG: hypothetical protein K8T26_05590 [Lentisphaerae bacterium]|nr:hypothetical protein [Lentisphaerota bacterium]
MTTRLAAAPVDWPTLHRKVVFGRAGGRIIWQPRIKCWFTDKQFAGEPLPAPYTGMTMPDIHRALGCSARLYSEFNRCFRRVEHPAVRLVETPLNAWDTAVTIQTPVGEQLAIHRRSPNNAHLIHIKWEVESEAEMRVATWREEHTAWVWDQAVFDEQMRAVGDLGAPTMFMPRMNVQSLYIEKMGIEKGIYALYDWPDAVETYFQVLEESHDRLMDVIIASPIEIVNFGENVHAGTLAKDLFLKYHLPACQRRCAKLRAAGRFTCSHWDGDTGPLLPYARETGLDGIEAITPKPQGDVTLEQIKEGLGDDVFLIDGIPAVYFDNTFTEDDLIRCTHRLIELFAPKLVLGISDEISSTGDLERCRIVGQIVDAYNAQFDTP